MGKALGVPVLVEGIETAEQLSFAKSLDCEEVQGYFHGRPMPETEVEKLLAVMFATDQAKTARKTGKEQENAADAAA